MGAPRLDGVLLDVDDTLVDTRAAFEEALAQVARVYLPDLPADRIADVLEAWRADRGRVVPALHPRRGRPRRAAQGAGERAARAVRRPRPRRRGLRRVERGVRGGLRRSVAGARRRRRCDRGAGGRRPGARVADQRPGRLPGRQARPCRAGSGPRAGRHGHARRRQAGPRGVPRGVPAAGDRARAHRVRGRRAGHRRPRVRAGRARRGVARPAGPQAPPDRGGGDRRGPRRGRAGHLLARRAAPAAPGRG